ncbi:hypothetical protein BTO06_05745 [Tenacibaculum sp. SZ-18]|uniref:RHS repeat domain-containing protein n=1 Tax=Tenacibaculum sp. SZ-18 TaxID=754423 RepID=UPI000C2D6587|nr:RHS repeat-associated core domain-containing protein [Tenacibaculum sp. SZ-18]AUC14672.1 hypothetical protein BTO06_05745 [Tenacibaculum sp. SZ-18]
MSSTNRVTVEISGILSSGEQVKFYLDNEQVAILTEPNVAIYYDDKGQRIKKESNIAGTYTKPTYYVRDASGNPMAIVTPEVGQTIEDADVEHPIYGKSRLGIYNKNSATSVYQLTDHLGNVRAVIAKQGTSAMALTSTTDYYTFGMPMPGRITQDGEVYRYGYQGQEVDQETEKEAFQLGLWDARIGRWLTTDPKHEFASLYLGMANNPLNKIDPDGGSTDDWVRKDGSNRFYYDLSINSEKDAVSKGLIYGGKTLAEATKNYINQFNPLSRLLGFANYTVDMSDYFKTHYSPLI